MELGLSGLTVRVHFADWTKAWRLSNPSIETPIEIDGRSSDILVLGPRMPQLGLDEGHCLNSI
jgi:hypothetical protein